MKKCWICGKVVDESASEKLYKKERAFYCEVRIVEVNRPYYTNHKSKPVYVCDKCSKRKIGISGEGENLNKE